MRRRRGQATGPVLVHLNHLEIGGTQLNAIDLAVALRKHSVETILVADSEAIPESGPTIIDVAATRGLTLELYGPYTGVFQQAREVARIARRHHASLIHVYGSWGGGSRATYWGPSRFGRLPWLQTVYEMEVDPSIKEHMALVVGTQYLAEDLRGRPGATLLVSPPVDTDADRFDEIAATMFRREHGLEAGTVITIVSRLDVRTKVPSIMIAIDAMRFLADRGASLVIVGDGEGYAALAARASQVNTEVGRRAVVLAGSMLDPRPAYSGADIMLGMGGSAARALAFGKPLIVQGDAGSSTLFGHDSAAGLARWSFWSLEEQQDPAEHLARVVSPLIDDAERRRALGRYGRDFAVGRFGLDPMAGRLLEAYNGARRTYGFRQWAADLPSEGRFLYRKILRRFQGDPRREMST